MTRGSAHPLGQWPLYALVILAPAGYLLNQQAYQPATLLVPALAVITAVTSLVSIGAGYAWLHETTTGGPAELAAEVATLVVMTAGIALLAHRAPVVSCQQGRSSDSCEAAPRTANNDQESRH